MNKVSSRLSTGANIRRMPLLQAQRGASLVEFSIVGLSVILVGLFTLQLGLLYHAKTTLNYAVFEAARAGAVNNASMSAMREELGFRLAPLHGGDGSRQRALLAVTRSALNMSDPLSTKVVILNPTKAAFRDWSIKDPMSGERFIPVNHLRHQDYAIGTHSGLSLRDANLLKLQVTHGVDLRVPVVGKLMTGPMQWIDAQNAAYYARGKWPIQSVATVRMQSDSFESEIQKSASSDAGSGNDENEGINGNTQIASRDEPNDRVGDDVEQDTGQVNGQGEGVNGGVVIEGPDDSQGNSSADNGAGNVTPPFIVDETADKPADDAGTDTGTELAQGEDSNESASGEPTTTVAKHCDENVLPGFIEASRTNNSSVGHRLMNTSKFRELVALRDDNG